MNIHTQANSGQGPLASKRVLVADGSTSARELLCTILEDSGMHVHAVCSWSAVASAARTFAPDAILLYVSWFTPESLALIADLRAMPECRATRLIALAPTALYPEPHSMAEAGFAAVLPKPITPQSLRRVLVEHLGGAGRVA